MKEDCGDLEELNALEEKLDRPYTIEQILNPKLKCTNGESMEEVKARMDNSIKRIVNENLGKKVAIISHGAAIKFFLMNWCKLSGAYLYYKGNCIRVNSPGVIKILIKDQEVTSIETIV